MANSGDGVGSNLSTPVNSIPATPTAVSREPNAIQSGSGSNTSVKSSTNTQTTPSVRCPSSPCAECFSDTSVNKSANAYAKMEPLALNLSGSSTPLGSHRCESNSAERAAMIRQIRNSDSLSSAYSSSVETRSATPTSNSSYRSHRGSAKLISPSGQRVQSLEIRYCPPIQVNADAKTGGGSRANSFRTAAGGADGGVSGGGSSSSSAGESWDGKRKPETHQPQSESVQSECVSPPSSEWTGTPRSSQDSTTAGHTTSTTLTSSSVPSTPKAVMTCHPGGPCSDVQMGSEQITPRSEIGTSEKSVPQPPVVDTANGRTNSSECPGSRRARSSSRTSEDNSQPSSNWNSSVFIDRIQSLPSSQHQCNQHRHASRTVSSADATMPIQYRAYSPRHAIDYKHCVTSEPDAIRSSRRTREDTHKKLFGKSDSPRHKPTEIRRSAENTYQTLFGAPPCPRTSSNRRGYTDSYRSIFGPPPTIVVKGNGYKAPDTPGLLSHDVKTPSPDRSRLSTVKNRYPLRHEDTRDKLFGNNGSSSSLSSVAGSASSSASNSPRMGAKHGADRCVSAPPPAEPVASQ